MEINIEKELIIDKNKSLRFQEIVDALHPYDADIIYIGGSLVEGTISKISYGMGNKYSDIDVFIIRKHNAFESTDSVYNQGIKKTFFVDNFFVGLDVEVFDYDYINKLLTILKNHKLNANERSRNTLSNVIPEGGSFTLINSFLNRLMYSICIYNIEEYSRLKSEMNFKNFLSIKRSNFIATTDNMYADVIGNMDNNQLDVAIICMRQVFMNVLNIVLATEDIFVDRDKWIPLKFRNFVHSSGKYMELWEAYLSLFYSDIREEAHSRAVLELAVKVTKKTLEDVLLGGLSL